MKDLDDLLLSWQDEHWANHRSITSPTGMCSSIKDEHTVVTCETYVWYVFTNYFIPLRRQRSYSALFNFYRFNSGMFWNIIVMWNKFWIKCVLLHEKMNKVSGWIRFDCASRFDYVHHVQVLERCRSIFIKSFYILEIITLSLHHSNVKQPTPIKFSL